MTIIGQKTYHALSSRLRCRSEHPGRDTLAAFANGFTSHSPIERVAA